ncbi:MAG: flagellar hook-length control protein FliK [Candidatus Hydrogenedens sp.]
MIDNIMNVLFPVVSGEITKTEPGAQENTNPNGSNFGQVLSILMAQMGLIAIPVQQDGNTSLSETEIHSDAQVNNVSSFITNPNNIELPSTIEGTVTQELVQLPDSGIEIDSITGQEDVQNKSLPVVDTDAKQDNPIIYECQDELLLQLGTNIEQRIAKVQSGQPKTKQSGVGIKTLTSLNSSQKGNSSIGSENVITPMDTEQMGKIETVELPQITEKLHIKNIGLSTILNPEEQQEQVLLKSGQVSNDKNIQNGVMGTPSNTQQKYTDILADLKHDLPENMDVEMKGNIFSKVPETKLISNSGEQTNSSSQHKSDLPNSNPQLGIFTEKYMKIGSEGASAKTPSVIPAESKDVVATLSSLRAVLTEQIKFAVRSETKTITVRLEPESLGLMEVKVQEYSGKIGIQLTTSNNEVHKILTQGLPQLREALKQEGIFVKDVQVISTGTASLMLNQDFSSHSFSRELHIEPVLSHFNSNTQQITEEIKPLTDYHNGTLSLWV